MNCIGQEVGVVTGVPGVSEGGGVIVVPGTLVGVLVGAPVGTRVSVAVAVGRQGLKCSASVCARDAIA